MCLTVRLEEFLSAKEAIKISTKYAKKDIIVWKRVNIIDDGYARAPFRYSLYDSPVIETTEFTGSVRNSYNFEDCLDVFQGIHAYRDEAEARRKFGTVVKCIIPKGTPYILGDNGDVVSLCLYFWE